MPLMAIQSSAIKTILIVVSFYMLPSLAMAKDISNEQRNAYEARQEFNKKQSRHQNLLTRILQQEKRLQEEEARLDKLKSEEQVAKTELDQATVNLESKVNALNNVWELRNR